MTINIPAPYDKYFRIAIPEEDYTVIEDDIQPGDKFDGYECHLISFLAPKTSAIEDIYPEACLTDDPDFPVVEWVGNRLYPICEEDIEEKLADLADED